MKQYSITEVIYLTYCKVRTYTVWSKARLIRFPIDIRNKKNIDLGRNLTTGVGCRIECFPINDAGEVVLKFGENVQMNDYVHITEAKSVEICDNVLMASKIYITDCSYDSYLGDSNDSSPLTSPIDRPLSVKPVKIENNVWLGEYVSVLPGVTIGQGTIVGANSVVSKSLPPNVIAVGAPAKPIKKFNFETNQWEKI